MSWKGDGETNMGDFVNACFESMKLAKSQRKVYYVAKNENGYFITSDWVAWLFKAYPGGRTILSVEGNRIMKGV